MASNIWLYTVAQFVEHKSFNAEDTGSYKVLSLNSFSFASDSLFYFSLMHGKPGNFSAKSLLVKMLHSQSNMLYLEVEEHTDVFFWVKVRNISAFAKVTLTQYVFLSKVLINFFLIK